MKIGLTYVKGAVPGFENFGNLPTDLVKTNGLVEGNKAHKELDALIIPGGTLIESNSIGTDSDLANEIKIMAKEGKAIIGICSGFQVLGNYTDVGRKSPSPILKEGLSLIDVNFSPLISNDRVEAISVNDSFLTKGLTKPITGFHCHTYGKVQGDGTPILCSSVNRMNYGDVKDYKLISGASNDDGNVLGCLIHNCLDENPELLNNILDYLDFTNKKDIIFKKNQELIKKINLELGIDTGISINKLNTLSKYYKLKKIKNQYPHTIIIGSTGSDSGKTFLTTGIAGVLRKNGLKVGLLKIGPDIRDIVPGLYLTKGLMEEYGSIKISHLGWMDIENTLKKLKESNYDVVLIEGVMSIFTGLLNRKIPYSGAEIAKSSNIPIILISGVNKGGIESAAIDLIAHTKQLKKMGIDTKGIVLNKVYDMDIFKNIKAFIEMETGISNIIPIPKIKMDERSTTPEVEIKLDEFSLNAYETINKYFDMDLIINSLDIPKFDKYMSFNEIKSYFNKVD